ncbi:4Fe-4S dicluster domain-containing protein [Zophobihabitans entericus]|uniref:4Fe-4S dicluster domain-containing protein n=1 Tax=Zophobihabitans entericus TaxID=1635327 RepID=A0A6G9IAM5_9GAMM|nr:4Fe-4S dicluster domain-containing protein [Zophobihabitans entericus]QIQ20774.1 4Fe-4S dicluster domain-containing protein [Zophobihabitans entericus]
MTNRFIAADANKCIGCRTCEIACVMSHTNDINMSPEYFQPRLQVIKGMTVTVPVMCKQCENAPCANGCPTNAIVRKNGSIQVIQERCIGCKTCVIACPFGAMTVVTQELEIAGTTQYQSQAIKCDLCPDNPTGPACVSVCPTHALRLVEPKSIEKLIKDKQKRTALEEISAYTI